MILPEEFCTPQIPDDFYLEYFRHNYHYNAVTGLLYRKDRAKPIGSVNSQGYLTTRMGPFKNRKEKKNFKVHHICWFLMDDQFIWPTGEINHIDGNRRNHKRENLEIVSRQENLTKRRKRSKVDDNEPF